MQNSECRVQNEITLTRAEIDALNKHNEKVKGETINKVFDEVEELLRTRYRIENSWASMCEDADYRGKFLYGRNVCESLIFDLKKLKARYEDETN